MSASRPSLCGPLHPVHDAPDEPLHRRCVVHSEIDAQAMVAAYPCLQDLPSAVVYMDPTSTWSPITAAVLERRAAVSLSGCSSSGNPSLQGHRRTGRSLLQPHRRRANLHLTVAGEPWRSPFPPSVAWRVGEDRVRFISGYIPDQDVLPCSPSPMSWSFPTGGLRIGPIHLTMGLGMPLVTTTVPAIAEACREYEASNCRTGESPILERSHHQVARPGGRSFANPHSWDPTPRNTGPLRRVE